MAQILFDHKCDPNKMNNKAQSPLMIALESGNLILVDYLINVAKVEITADTSHDGKTLLHYFAMQCDEYDLVKTLSKIVMYYFHNCSLPSAFFFIISAS